MIKNKRVLPIVLLIILVGLSFMFDRQIAVFFSQIRGYLLNEVFLGFTFISSEIVIFFVLTSLFLWQENKRKWILPLWFTMFLSVVVSLLLKIGVHRLRPYQLGIVDTLPVFISASHLVWDFSFPSFHAVLAFSTLPLLSKEFPKLKYFWIVFAGLIAISRIYFGIHFLSDVIAGAIVGYLIGLLVLKLEMKNKFSEKIYQLIKKK